MSNAQASTRFVSHRGSTRNLLCIGVCITYLRAKQSSKSNYPAHSNQIEAQQQPEKSLWDRTKNDLTALYTLVIAIFTAVLATVAAFQMIFIIRSDKTTRISAEAAKTSADVARASLHELQRAFVHIHEMNNTWLKEGLQITPVWINNGNTPARKLKWFTGGVVVEGEHSLPANFSFPAQDAAGNEIDERMVTYRNVVIGPHATFRGQRSIISESRYSQIIRREITFYIYGWAFYNDVFEGTKLHVTKFCFRADPIQTQDGKTDIGYELYHRHNCIDEECETQA